jgi:ParB-like chromosome segregation protein Spo0J
MSNISPPAEVKIIPFHSLAKNFPLMNGVEFNELVADVKANGLREPITLYQDQILDGRNRYRACLKAKVEPRFEQFEGNDAAALAFVISKNIHRRHLKAREKREAIAKLLKAQPEKSDRQIGEMIKADNKTVASVRAEQEAREEIPHVESRTDTKGRKQPAKKARKQPAEKQTATELFDEVTGQTFKPLDPKGGIKNPIIRAWCKATNAQRREFALEYKELIEGIAAEEQRRIDDRERSRERRVVAGNDPGPDVSADNMKAQFAALDDGSDPGPIPESPRRDTKKKRPITIEGTATHVN